MTGAARAALAAALVGALPLPAFAGRPMAVDDAGIVGAHQCQLESWIQDNRDSTEVWTVPACNVGGQVELALGGARTTGPAGAFGTVVLQAKTEVRALQQNGWGAGFEFGNQATGKTGWIGDLYAKVPVSFSFRDDRLLVHVNGGWLREKIAARNVATWGVGAETRLSPRTALTSETFGQQHGKPFVQLGIKHWLVVDRVQLDATYGRRPGSGGAQGFVSAGIVVFSGKQP